MAAVFDMCHAPPEAEVRCCVWIPLMRKETPLQL